MKGKKMTLKEKMQKLESDKNARKKLFKQLCDHVALGYSVESFSEISTVSISKFLKEYPDDFVQGDLDLAKQKGRDWWEGIGRRQASGDCLGNSRTWYYNMANRYGWREKLEVEAEHKGSINVNVVSYASKKASQANESHH
jgi:hypothetical protein